MNNKINMSNDYVLRKSKITGNDNINQNVSAISGKKIENNKSFQEILQKVKSVDNVKFSKHASNRLESRNINLTETEITKLNDAVNKADSKGVREALIMMDNKVFIASVKNKTIITASERNELKDNVFTNIDGAVII
jgi:flagellar operon protein